jgi:capsular polysaccharide transport system permease protein
LNEGLAKQSTRSLKPDVQEEPMKTTPKVEDGFGSEAFPTASATKKPVSRPGPAANTIDAIKAEGLTGRQLRLARRVAQRHGLTPQTDFEAVKMLRDKGIDPFEKGAMLELVVPEGQKPPAVTEARPNLPQKAEPAKPAPRPEPLDEAARASEVYRIQKDIARRRRRKLAMLWARLSAFVLIPTALVGYYFYVIATPLYATKTEFLIQQADSQASSGLGGLFSGTGFATSQDSITVQSYLQSRDAMLRLDADIGFKSHFSSEDIDVLRRLAPDATNEEAYRLYRKMVKIGYDPTEGIVKMEVIATDPQTSERYSRALIEYAEEQVDNLTQRLRGDQMKGSRESFEQAETKMLAAQQKVLELQERLGVIDAASEASAVMSQVSIFETQLQEKRLQLQQLLDNARPNQARVDGVKGDITRLEALIAELRSELTQSGSDSASLARISGELRLAELELETRTAMMQQALQQLETSRIEANRQVRYLSMGVTPVAPDEPTYPRAFENTAVSLLIFAGIYLMMSLTASILREQVSA